MNAREEESLGEARARAEESLRFPLMVSLNGVDRREELARDAIALTDSVKRLLVRVQEEARDKDFYKRQLDAVDAHLRPWEPDPNSDVGCVGRVQTILNLKADRLRVQEAERALRDIGAEVHGHPEPWARRIADDVRAVLGGGDGQQDAQSDALQ